MDEKVQMINNLIENEKFPFVEADREGLMTLSKDAILGVIAGYTVDEDAIRKEIRQEMEGESNDLRGQIDVLTKRIEASEKIADTEREARLRIEFKNFLDENTVPGDAKELVESMIALSKLDDKSHLENMKKSLAAAGAAIKQAGLMREIGSAEEGIGEGSAYAKLQAEKEKVMRDRSLSEVEAWRAVCKENPKLYEEYQKENKRKR